MRRRRVIRYAILYFTLLILFVVLIVAPLIARKFVDLSGISLPMNLVQPTGLNNNDTSASHTGNGLAGADSTAAASAASSASGAARRWAFNEFAY